MNDAFARVADLPGVSDHVAEARDAVDRLLGHRVLRRRRAEVAAEAAVRGARASAALEGHAVPLDALRRGEISDPVVNGALRASADLGDLLPIWRNAPRQVLARLHVLAAGDLEQPGELGRPRADVDLGRLDGLCALLVAPTKAPALVCAAVAHGEMLALRPFAGANGVVARAVNRLTIVDRGLDPSSLVAPDVGHLELADAYATSLNGYISGTPAGLAGWIGHCSTAVVLAARDSLAVCEALERA